MGARWNVVSGVAWRTLKNALTNPQIFLPTMLFPLFFFTAFAGGLSQLREIPGSTIRPATPRSSSSSCCCSRLRSAVSSRASGSPATSRADSQSVCCSRLRIEAESCVGYALAAVLRWMVVATILTVVALIAGMQIGGSSVDLVGLYVLALLVNFCGFFWSGDWRCGSARSRPRR